MTQRAIVAMCAVAGLGCALMAGVAGAQVPPPDATSATATSAASAASAASAVSAGLRSALTPGAAASATVHALRAAGIARVTESEGAVRATVPGDSLWEIAGAVTSRGLDRNQVMVAIMRRNPEAFPEGNLHRIERGLSLTIPPLSEMRREDPRQSAALVVQHQQAYLNRAVVPMPLYALPGEVPASAASAVPVPASAAPLAAPASSAAGAGAGVLQGLDSTPAPAASSATADAPAAVDRGAAPPAPVPWLPVIALLACGAGAGLMLLWRRRGGEVDEAARDAAERERVSRLFADSRLALESQLLEQPDADSEPLYSTLDEPVDALPLPLAQPGTPPPSLVLVLRNGGVSELAGSQAPAVAAPPASSGGALALALTVAHAYADVGRPEAARRWLRAIDARGAGAFQESD